MRLRLFVLFVFLGAVVSAGACSLNPQPYPPDNYDAAADGAVTFSPDGAGGGTDASEEETANPGAGDGSVDATDEDAAPNDDASDGETDAGEDASDAGDAGDASTDVGFDE